MVQGKRRLRRRRKNSGADSDGHRLFGRGNDILPPRKSARTYYGGGHMGYGGDRHVRGYGNVLAGGDGDGADNCGTGAVAFQTDKAQQPTPAVRKTALRRQHKEKAYAVFRSKQFPPL